MRDTAQDRKGENRFILRGYQPGYTTIRDLPYFDQAILRAAGDDIIVVWTPRDVQDRAFVSADQGVIRRYPSSLRTTTFLSDGANQRKAGRGGERAARGSLIVSCYTNPVYLFRCVTR